LSLAKYQEAIAAYERAIALKPDYYRAWNNRGAALEELERTKEALNSYNQALQINSDYQASLNNRRRLLLELSLLLEN
jgi:Flp pilus assembly protein TadD